MKPLNGYLRGVDLGGWLSQGKLEKEHLDTFIMESDIDRIASWGLDHVRLPIDFENIETEDGEIIEAGYQYIENCISWCRKNKLNIVMDLHKTYGYIFDDPEYSKNFFDDIKLQDRFVQTWDRLSSRFAKDADMIMFELLNEVTRFDVVEKWNKIALRCIATIRKNAPTAKILYGGVGYNAITSVKWLAEPVDENIVYNFHCYEPLVFTHQTAWWCNGMPKDFHIEYPGNLADYNEATNKIPGAKVGAFADDNLSITELNSDFFANLFKEAVDVAEEHGVSLYCGEYGVIDQAPTPDTLRWFKDIHDAFEKFGIGRACWTYKQLDFGLIDDHYKDILDDLIKLL